MLIVSAIGVFISSLLVAFIVARVAIGLFKSIGHVGVDVHKPCRVEAAESVGVSVLAGLIAGSAFLFFEGYRVEALAFSLSILISGIIGIMDDFLVLNARLKILLGTLPAVPVLLLGVYEPRPLVPMDGFARLTIVYPLALPIVYTVSTNGFNMYDTHNGVMLSSALIMSLAMAVAGYMQYNAGVEGSELALILGLAIAGASLGMLYYNLYPSKAFNGDVGSFTVGAAVASAAIMGRVEAVALIAGLPIALNGFLKISSIGFKERRSFERPVELRGWLIKSRLSERAPLSLPALITSRTPLSEPELVIALIMLTWLSSSTALVTIYLTLRGLA